MLLVVGLFGALIAIVGLWGFVYPAPFLVYMKRFVQSPKGLVWIISIRLLMGCFLILAASQTRFPVTFYVLGGITIAAGIATAMMGREFIDKYIDWWDKKPAIYLRIPMLLGWILGVFIIYAVI